MLSAKEAARAAGIDKRVSRNISESAINVVLLACASLVRSYYHCGHFFNFLRDDSIF